jgi:hypothetical protein
LPPPLIERRIAWPRTRAWRPGEPLTLTIDGLTTTCLLRGVNRDANPKSAYATVTLEPVRELAAEEDALPATG